MRIEPIGYVMECEDYTMSIIRATLGEYAPHAVAVYTESQLSQAMEACAAVCKSKEDAELKIGKVDHNEMPWVTSCAIDIRNLIKEMFG